MLWIWCVLSISLRPKFHLLLLLSLLSSYVPNWIITKVFFFHWLKSYLTWPKYMWWYSVTFHSHLQVLIIPAAVPIASLLIGRVAVSISCACDKSWKRLMYNLHKRLCNHHSFVTPFIGYTMNLSMLWERRVVSELRRSSSRRRHILCKQVYAMFNSMHPLSKTGIKWGTFLGRLSECSKF